MEYLEHVHASDFEGTLDEVIIRLTELKKKYEAQGYKKLVLTVDYSETYDECGEFNNFDLTGAK